jgi:hypothetical protein
VPNNHTAVFMRGVLAFIAGWLVAATIIVIARQLAFGHGLAVSPTALSMGAQTVVAAGWLAGAALGTGAAVKLAHRHTPGLVVSAWLFQMAWLSPGVRPAELIARLVCAVAVSIGGFGVLAAWRLQLWRRQPAG